jgi:hypothetical protein
MSGLVRATDNSNVLIASIASHNALLDGADLMRIPAKYIITPVLGSPKVSWLKDYDHTVTLPTENLVDYSRLSEGTSESRILLSP